MNKKFTVYGLQFTCCRSSMLLIFFFVLTSQFSIFNFASAQSGWVPTSQSPVPAKPNHLVNDWAGMLSASEANQLEQKLDHESDSTSTQIAILTIDNLNGYDISSLAFKIGDAWGIGGPDQDNGVLILVSKNDHDVFIATGRGMEGPIPDVTAKRIIDNIILPDFKDGEYYKGLDEATDAIIKLAAGEFVNELNHGNTGTRVENEVERPGPVYTDFQNNQTAGQLKRNARRAPCRSETNLRGRVSEKYWTEQT